MTQRALTAGLVILLLTAGCSAGTPEGTIATTPAAAISMAMPMTSAGSMSHAASRLVDPAVFAAAVTQPGVVTIDVHIPFQGKIAGTDLMIPYNQIAKDSAELPVNHSTELAIYCRSGNMSAIAAPELAALGYTDIVELKGGMQAWQASGRSLLTTP